MTTLIRMTGIEAEGCHGVREDERKRPQPFVVDLEIEVESDEDDLAATADYDEVARVVRGLVATESYRLIETLVGRIARVVAELPRVRSCRAVVHKPRAAEGLGVRDVSAQATVDGAEQPSRDR